MSGFELPERGSPEMTDLLVRLEQARYENAEAFVVVVTEKESGVVAQAVGPFVEAEQALVAAGEQDNDWRKDAEPGEEDIWDYTIVPLFEAGQ